MEELNKNELLFFCACLIIFMYIVGCCCSAALMIDDLSLKIKAKITQHIQSLRRMMICCLSTGIIWVVSEFHEKSREAINLISSVVCYIMRDMNFDNEVLFKF